MHDREKDRKRKSTMEQSDTPTAAKQQNISSPHKEASTPGSVTRTPGQSRATQYRQLKNLSDKLPKSPNSFAQRVTGIVKSATPRKKAELKRQGVVRCLEDELVADLIKKHVKALKNTKGEHKWKKLCCLANMINIHQGRKAKISRHLGMSFKMLSRTYIDDMARKKRLVTITPKARELIGDLWKSPEVSRIMPLKKRVKKGAPTFLLEHSYGEAYRLFKVKYPESKVSYCSFLGTSQTMSEVSRNMSASYAAVNHVRIPN